METMTSEHGMHITRNSNNLEVDLSRFVIGLKPNLSIVMRLLEVNRNTVKFRMSN